MTTTPHERSETMTQTITIRTTIYSLHLSEETALDYEASGEAYGALVREGIRAAYPTAEIAVEIQHRVTGAGTGTTVEIRDADGMPVGSYQDENIIEERVAEILSEIHEDRWSEWSVYATTITDEKIRALRGEAEKAGDLRQAMICVLALGGSRALRGHDGGPDAGTDAYDLLEEGMTQDEAREECERVIAGAAAQQGNE